MDARGGGDALHFLIVDPAFHDAGAPGPTRSYDLATRFIAGGHRVTALSGMPGTPATVAGFTVRTAPFATSSGWDFPASERPRFARWALGEMRRIADADAVIVTAEPWSLLPPAALYAWVRAIPLIVDVRTLPPKRPPANAPLGVRCGGFFRRLMRRLALMLARRTMIASPSIGAALAAEGLPEAKRLQLPMGCDVPLLTRPAGTDNAVLQDTPELAGHPLVVWAGCFSADRNLTALVDFAAALQEAAPQAMLVLCGDGPQRPEIIRLIHERGLPESAVMVLGPLPRARMAEMLAAATIVLALPSANDTASDFFDGLAAGKPVVYLGDGWPRQHLESRGAGFGLVLDDPQATAREIADIMRNADGLRRAGQQAAALAAGRFNLDRLVAEVRVAIEALIAAAPRAEILRTRTLFWKRAIDIAVSGAALIVLSPLIVLLAVLIGAQLGWPVIVSHDRAGAKGRPFRLFKFRTLTDAEDPTGALQPESARQTPLGQFLRRSALDELPTLLNVLLGDMSLVGPRPHPVAYTAYYSPAQRRRLDLRPGLTGLSQVDTSPNRTWDDKFAHDSAYVDRVTLGLDANILGKTVLILLRGRNLDRQTAIPRFDEMMANREGAEDA